MITELTPEQREKIQEYQTRYWRQVISTEPANRSRTEAAARRLAEIGGVKIDAVTWVDSPMAGKRAYDAAVDAFQDLLQAALKAALQDFLNAPISASLLDVLRTSLQDSLQGPLRTSLQNSIRDSLWYALGNSLQNLLRGPLWHALSISFQHSLQNSLRESLYASFLNSPRTSFRDPLRTSLRDSLWDSLRDSLWNPFRNSDWLSYGTYAVEVLGIECTEKHCELLMLYNELAESCFALWVVPGTIILCQRPESVEFDDGRFLGLTWRKGD